MSKVTINFWDKEKERYEDITCDFLIDSSLNVFAQSTDYGLYIKQSHEPHFYKDGERIDEQVY